MAEDSMHLQGEELINATNNDIYCLWYERLWYDRNIPGINPTPEPEPPGLRIKVSLKLNQKDKSIFLDRTELCT